MISKTSYDNFNCQPGPPEMLFEQNNQDQGVDYSKFVTKPLIDVLEEEIYPEMPKGIVEKLDISRAGLEIAKKTTISYDPENKDKDFAGNVIEFAKKVFDELGGYSPRDINDIDKIFFNILPNSKARLGIALQER